MVTNAPDKGLRYTEFVAMALEAERGAARLSIGELAARSGVPERTLARVLHAERDITVAQVYDLALAFGLRPSDIFNDAEKRMVRQQSSTGDQRQDSLLNAIAEPDMPRGVTEEMRGAKVHPVDPPVRARKARRNP